MSDVADARFVPRSGESWRDPFTMYAALRDHDPVHQVESTEGDYWVLSRFDDIMEAAIDFKTFSSAQGLTFSYGAHHCIGAAIARLQATITLEELLARCPGFAVDAGAAEFAGGHFVRRYQALPFKVA